MRARVHAVSVCVEMKNNHTHAEALAELIAEVDQFLDKAAAHIRAPTSLEESLESAKNALSYHRPHEHAFDRRKNERKDDL